MSTLRLYAWLLPLLAAVVLICAWAGGSALLGGAL